MQKLVPLVIATMILASFAKQGAPNLPRGPKTTTDSLLDGKKQGKTPVQALRRPNRTL